MDIVTGSFGYIGGYITRLLLERGETVRTITTHPDKPNPFRTSVQAFPFDFDKPNQLTENLRGCDTLYNTYWIRFPYKHWTFESAIHNTQTLFACAGTAGIRKIVHISVTNASLESPLPYYKGKAEQEKLLANSGIEAANAPSGTIVDAIGPESYTFAEFITLIIQTLGTPSRPVHVSPRFALFFGRLIGYFLRDVVLTTTEIQGLMNNLLTSNQAPNGFTKFSTWADSNQDLLGRTYSSELKRHYHWRLDGQQVAQTDGTMSGTDSLRDEICGS